MFNDPYVDAEPAFSNVSGGQVLSVVLPFAVAAAGLALGLVVGSAGGWMAKSATIVEVPRELTLAEVTSVCEPRVEEATTVLENDLDLVKAKVSVLQQEVKDKEEALAQLRTRKRSGTGGGSVALAKAKEELARVKLELRQAQEEKQELIDALTMTTQKLAKTEQALEEQVEETQVAKEDALDNKWHRFIGESQLEICERGNRKKLGRCRETVTALVGNTAIQKRFDHCVRTDQAVPTVHEAADRDMDLPAYSYWLSRDERITAGWYLTLCDPTLPEPSGTMDDIVERAEPGLTASAKPMSEDDFDDLLADID